MLLEHDIKADSYQDDFIQVRIVLNLKMGNPLFVRVLLLAAAHFAPDPDGIDTSVISVDSLTAEAQRLDRDVDQLRAQLNDPLLLTDPNFQHSLERIYRRAIQLESALDSIEKLARDNGIYDAISSVTDGVGTNMQRVGGDIMRVVDCKYRAQIPCPMNTLRARLFQTVTSCERNSDCEPPTDWTCECRVDINTGNKRCFCNP